jgi:hypothetical protein
MALSPLPRSLVIMAVMHPVSLVAITSHQHHITPAAHHHRQHTEPFCHTLATLALPNAATLRPIVDYGRLSPTVPPTPVAACPPLPWVFLLDQAKLVFCSARRLVH